MPVEEYVPAADAGPEALEAAQYDWLRRHGQERGCIDAALSALRDDLDRRVHPSSVVDPAATTAGGAPGRGPAADPPAPARSLAVVASLTAADRRAMLTSVAAATAAGHDPDRFYPGWRDKLLGSAPSALVASGSGMTTAEYNRRQRERAAQ